MNRIDIPSNVNNLLTKLRNAGFEAFAVGGCVRDGIMGKAASDWDLASSASPAQLMEIFGSLAIPTGILHGTITVKTAGENVEITSFRTEGAYSDRRRPDTVSFDTNLLGDLSRRDFTMNAIALSPEGELIDPFGGISDIERRTIRCVGSAPARFAEDALRMLRALRFSAQLGFDIEEQTLSAIFEKAHLAKNLSPERIFAEISKMLMADNMQPLNIMLTTHLLSHLEIAPAKYDFTELSSVLKNRLFRWSAFCSVLFFDKPDLCKNFLNTLRADKLLQNSVYDALEIMSTSPSSIIEWKRALSRYGESSCRCSAWAMHMHGTRNGSSLIDEILASGECFRMESLAIDGKELAAEGFRGRELGVALRRLLAHVIEHPADNEKALLLPLAKKQEEEIAHKISTFLRIAQAFEKGKIIWAVGASLLLYLKEISDNFNDIDLLIREEDVPTARAILENLGRPKPTNSSTKYKSAAFLEYEIDGVEIDLIAGFTISANGQDHRFPLTPESISEHILINSQRIPLQSPEYWRRLYLLMGRHEKALMIARKTKKL